MTRLLLLLTVVGLIFVALNRQRIFLRDPLAAVQRSGVHVTGARVFINYSNDALIQEGSTMYIVQGWNKLPATPLKLTCIQEMACLTDQDRATTTTSTKALVRSAEMNNREITYVNPDGQPVHIVLR